ncbi:MAG: phosphoenolpyruvate synthase [Candidatus Pacearchaeota archaeon]|nr:phosphoenolpyruvate synthase [Candidatus Pacearchaeota archaeon]
MKEKEEKIDFVKWFSELDKNSVPIAGGKGANLAEIYNLKINVPPGFVVTTYAYDYFIEKAGLKEKINEILNSIEYEDTKDLEEKTKKIREMIVKSNFPKEMEEEVVEAYELLDTNNMKNVHGILDILKKSEPVFVAARSSATAEDLADASFAGQQETFLNVKGKTELIISIKKCFASLFTARATYYRHRKGFEKVKVSLSVVIQRMVDSDKSGVIFSKDPTNRTDNIIIEAVFGLGEGIVSGAITPDKYIVSPDLKILDKVISDKKIAVTRDSGGGQRTVKLSEEKSRQQVLKDYEIKKFAEISLRLEDHYKKPQDIEFAVEGEGLYVLQTRAVTTREKKFVEGGEIKGEVILSGLGASPGVGSGKVKVIKDLADLNKIVEGDILVTTMTNPDMVVTMQKSAAIITDEGGMTAHAAIVSREMGIPAVVGTREATDKLKDGDIVTVDGNSGKIYLGKVAETKQKEILPVTARTKTKIKLIVDLPTFAERASRTGVKQVGLTRIEGIIAESGKHPNYFLNKGKIEDYEEVIFKGLSGIAKYFDEMWVRTSDIRSDEFQNLEGASGKVEVNPMLGMHGIRYGVKNPKILKAELKALKRVADSGKKIGIMMPQIISVEEVQVVKDILKEINFSDAKVGVMVETPAAVQIIKELCEEGIEFISFGTNDLTQYILAIDRGNEEVQHLYNEMHPAVLYQIEFVIRVCKRNGVETSICGQAGSRKDMVKFLVERGIDSISVNADVAKEISDYVAEIEKERGEEPRQYTPETEKKENSREQYNKGKFTKETVLYFGQEEIIPEETPIEEETPVINGVEENHKKETEEEETFYEEGVAPPDAEEKKGVLDIF